jgi:hypothetical protein
MRFLIAALLLAGCATQIMEGYVGKPIQEAMLDYGAPTSRIDMPDGTVAYQWRMTTSATTPITANTFGYPNGMSQTVVSGGQTVTSDCLYTLFVRTGDDGVERVAGFKKPSLMCS